MHRNFTLEFNSVSPLYFRAYYIHKNIMHICIMYSKEYLKGTIKTLLLSLLDEKGDMYGYEISQTVKLRSEGEIQLTEGALYPALHKLETNVLVSSYFKMYDGRKRKYYTLTDKGKREVEKAKQGWKAFSETINSILNPLNYA